MGIPIQNAQIPQRDIFNISAFSGVNKSVTPSQIGDSEASDILNFMLDEQFALDKRPGYMSVFRYLTGGTGIKGMFYYKKPDGTELIIFSYAGKLYAYHPNLISDPQVTNNISNGNFASGTSGWTPLYGTSALSVASNTLQCTGDGNYTTVGAEQATSIVAQTGHLVYVRMKAKISSLTNLSGFTLRVLGSLGGGANINYTLGYLQNYVNFDVNGYFTISFIANINALCSGTLAVGVFSDYDTNAHANGKSLFIQEVIAIELTTQFGAGNEPTLAELDATVINVGWFSGTVGNPLTLYNGVTDASLESFRLNDKIYFLDGTHFLVYDGTSVADVLVNAYVPTITLGRTPTGGGTSNEQWNQIGRGFIDSFSSNGSSTVYTLSFSGLDADAVVVTYNSVIKTEGAHFTVDRTAGTINFAAGSSPLGAPTSGTNNVTIKAYKTQSDYTTRKNKILNCTKAILFGGSNDTRVLLSCNSNTKNVIYRSGLTITGMADPTYWPENTYNLIGANNEQITGMSKQYDALVIHKESTTYLMNFSLDGNSLPVYTTKPINDTVGLSASNSVQIIENNPTFLNKKGVWRLIQSNVRDERNMRQISDNIDTVLLNESNLQNAISVDFNRKYIINVNGKCYIYDYNQETNESLGAWFIWDNINASCFLEYNNYLYFGSKTLGKIYKFNKATDSNAYYDDDSAITCRWRSKLLAMSAENFYKLIDKLYITLKPNSRTSAKIYYSTDAKDDVYKNEIQLVSFDFSNLDFNDFTFENTTLPKTFRLDIKEKKIVYFQILIENTEGGESLGILNIGIQHAIQKQI